MACTLSPSIWAVVLTGMQRVRAMSELHKAYPLTITYDGEDVEVLCWFRFYSTHKGVFDPDEQPFIDLLDVRVLVGYSLFKDDVKQSVSILCLLSPAELKLIEGMLLEEMLINGE